MYYRFYSNTITIATLSHLSFFSGGLSSSESSPSESSSIKSMNMKQIINTWQNNEYAAEQLSRGKTIPHVSTTQQ